MKNYDAKPGANGVKVITWELAPGDTAQPYEPEWNEAATGSVQFSGTFGGAVVGLRQSNDGAEWWRVFLEDGNTFAGEDDARNFCTTDFKSAARYLRPNIFGGLAYAITVTMVLRG
ncbi:hypothetical protein [Rubellimicrobium mesophilum]|uniref:hypothetical protein n=1 Tax=Rubellimicrobium mesophilum TaxID=1123067 RepID=UPI0012E117FE|nr:hypothetical protein [Rubellimicrobium mesophilum]